ncbi:MAG: chemotaxis protein CheX [Thermoanaerobaculales bacterium]|jgi:CheY-specific phosphatase CheX|nr:chemotaxis protein CheX [Thermoanaerobaculales bacterium]
MKPNPEQVRNIVHTVWSTQLGMDIHDSEFTPEMTEAETLTAAVHITGDFRGGIVVECSRLLVRRAASVMFSRPAEDLSPDDERDVIGELTNVVAGNIKALVTGANSLSLPTIVEGTDYQVSSMDVKTSDEYHFALDGEAMTLTLVEHS